MCAGGARLDCIEDQIQDDLSKLLAVSEKNASVGAAAESYFKKKVNDLTLSESALLAGLIPAPSDYEPRAGSTEAMEPTAWGRP